jgi:hypothetical protein
MPSASPGKNPQFIVPSKLIYNIGGRNNEEENICYLRALRGIHSGRILIPE